MLILQALRTRLDALPRDSRDTLFLLAVVAVLVLPQAGHLPLWCSALVTALLAWRAWLTLSGRPLPGRPWRAGLLVAALAATLLTHGTLLGRDAGVTLIIVLLALKTLELRARRDAFVVFFLGFFAILTHFFFSQSLLTALLTVPALLGLLMALVNAHLPVGRPPLAQSARAAATMLLLGIPVMVALFLLFPRLPPLWGLSSDGLTGRSGLAASMQVGQVARLALDNRIAMRVRFEGRPPAQADLYFRGPVLANFDGREWRPLYPSLLTLPAPAIAARRARLTVSGEPVRYEVTLEPALRPWLPLLDATDLAPQVPGHDPVRTPELQWLLRQPATDVLRYRAQSHLDYRQGPFTQLASLPLEYRELPASFNPRTLQLATDLMRASATPAEDKAALVDAALTLLHTGGYTYTLEPGIYGAQTADEFWFDRKQGFCEHIASAFTVLMRAMDIPARIVTGYQGGERDPVDGAWVVRHSDAHAWVEVWLSGRGWLRVDPTSAVAPGRTGSALRLQPAPGALAGMVGAWYPTLAESLSRAWQALDGAWSQRVLNFTQSRQLDLLRQLGFKSPDWVDLARTLLALGAVACGVGAAWALWERRQHNPWLRLMASARAKLARRGLSLAPCAGPRQMALAVRQRFGPEGAPLADWLLRMEAQRYAAAGNSRLGLRALRREWCQLAWPP